MFEVDSMVVLMRKKINEKKIVQVEANSCHGNGVFYITDKAIVYEVDSRGIYLNFIPHKMIKKFARSPHILFGSRKYRVTWLENNTEHYFEFRTKQHKQLQNTLDDVFPSR